MDRRLSVRDHRTVVPARLNPNLAFAIVGGGLAGGVAVRTLRQEGYDGRLLLVTDEPGVPFGRPPLSKTYLRGEEGLVGWLVEPAEWYDQNQVEILRATATRLDVAGHRLELDTGGAVEYAKLLVATGGRNRRFDAPGAELDGVFQLRTVAESDAIRQAAGAGARALVVGMGFIGCEVAASLRVLGVEVTAVFPGAAPLESVLGKEVGAVMTMLHKEHGVELIAGDSVARFEGAGRVQRAVTKNGRTIDCDFAVVAVGIQPNVELVRDTGIPIDNGVLVDAACRTNVPDIFAAGDVANLLHPLFGRLRVEHYNNAEKQGAAAARSMLGSDAEYSYLHTFWSDEYDEKLEYAGHARKWDEFVFRGSMDERRLVGFYLEDGVLKAAVGLNRGGDPELDADGEMAQAARLIARRARPRASDLARDDGDLDGL
jgi:3-phenylpropionate/trans-cinnamate dioxygenase ferredoxin reductase subunit